MAYCDACSNMGCPQCNYGEREEIPFDDDTPIDGVGDDCDPCGPDIDWVEEDFEPLTGDEDFEDGYGGWQDDPCPEFDG